MTSKFLLPQEEEEDGLGPAMKACSPQERKFVHALFEGKPSRGNGAGAARVAGYGNSDGTSSPQTMASIANRLFHRPRIIEAVRELTKGLIRAEAPTAVNVVREVMADKDHKDRLRAAFGVLERLDPVETKHDISVTHWDERQNHHDTEALKVLRWLRSLEVPRAKLIEALGINALPRLEQMLAEEEGAGSVIEGEFREVADD